MNIKKTGQMETYGQVRLERPEARVNTHPATTHGTAAPQTDTVSVSDEALLRTEAYRTAMNAPDMREDKVNSIKEQVDNGTYSINSRRIAANLLGMERDLFA